VGTSIRPEVPLSPAEQLRRAQERPAGVSPAEQLRQAHDLARPMDQSQSARVLRLQGQTAFPTDFVERNLDALEKQVSEPDFDADRFWKESPNVAQWLAQDPARVGATGRDIQRMGSVERYLRAIGTEFERNKITIQLNEPTLASMMGRSTPEQEAEIAKLRRRQSELPQLGPEGFIAGIPVATIGQLPILFELYKSGAKGAVIGAGVMGGAALVAGQAGPQAAIPEELATVPAAMARGAYLGSRPGVILEGIKLEATQAYLDYREMEGVTREDAAIGAFVAGIVSGSMEAIPFGEATKRIPILRMFGRDGIRQMLAAPSTRALLRRAVGDIFAQGLAEGGTEGLQYLVTHIGGVITKLGGSGQFQFDANTAASNIGNALPGGEPFVVGRMLPAEGFGDRPEGYALTAEQVLRMMFNEEVAREFLANVKAGTQAGFGFGAVTASASTGVDYRGARRAEQNAARMRAAAEAIHGNDRDGAMAMAKDAPEAMRQAVASMNAEGGFYDVSAWSAYWQSQQTATGEAADPRQVALALGVEPEAYDAAVASGAPINVPADRLLVDAMGSKTHQEWLVNNLRSTPNEMSKAEADAMRQEAERPMEEVSETEGNARVVEADEAVATFAERLTEQLRSTKMVAGDVAQNVTLWSEAARTAIARNPDIPVADVMRRFEQVQVTALPVAVDATGRAVSAYEVTNEMVTREDGVQVPLLRSTRTAQTQLAKQERRLAERYQGDESRMPEREREQLAQARQSVADANAVNSQLVPFPTIAELQGLRQGQGEPSPRMDAIRRMIAETRNRLDPSLTPEQRAAFAVYLNADVLEQAAFHGTPHEIKDRFRLDKIGTGEGAQAYGWGLYFAQLMDIAEGYRRQLSDMTLLVDGQPVGALRDNEKRALESIASLGYEEAVAREERTLDTFLAEFGSDENFGPADERSVRDMRERLGVMRGYAKRDVTFQNPGNLYQVDIPDAAVATYLDWDKPLSEQAPEVREAVRTLLPKLPDVAKGWQAYDAMKNNLMSAQEPSQRSGLETYAEAASKALLAAGIRGIKYLDAGSRAPLGVPQIEANLARAEKRLADIEAGTLSDAVKQAQRETLTAEIAQLRKTLDDALATPQSRNLVVFDESDVTITHRNGEPVTAQERTDFLAQEGMQGEMAPTFTPEQEAAYAEATAKRDKREARKIVEAVLGYEAKDWGVNDYQGAHTPAGPGSGAPAFDLTDIYPDDVYSSNAVLYYGTGDEQLDRAAFNAVLGLRDNPKASVKIYRAVPKDSPQKKINGGDWVTTVRAYAKEHGEGTLRGEYRIISKTVKARDIYTSGDSMAEWGYHPQERAIPAIAYKGPTDARVPLTLAEMVKRYGPKVETAEPLSETIDVDGVSRPTTNSMGQPIHPTAEGVRNFWRWATEDGREPVMDADGKPIRFYHGTADTFTEFAGQSEYFLTDTPEVANTYVRRSTAETRRLSTERAEEIAAFEEAYSAAGFPPILMDTSERYWLSTVDRTLDNAVESGSLSEESLANLRALANAVSDKEYQFGEAESEMRGAAPQVLPVYVRMANRRDVDANNLSWELVTEKAIENARADGNGGVVIANVEDNADDSEYKSTVAVVFDGADIKSALANSGAFGPSADILKQTTPENEPRGAFIADPTRSPSGARVDGPRLVAMFKERNQSTFLHESAHAFLDIWATLADDPRADPAFRQRVVDLKGELGAEPDATLTEAQEEAFAGMFLDYAKSGVAPSEALRVAFASFGKWLSRLWSILKGEIVPASPKVRDLLNRMLATDEAIEEAQGLYMAPLFPDDAAINEAFVKARTEAEGKTRAEAMLTIRRAEQEWWKRESKQVMEEVTQTIHADPAYIARQALTALENTDGSPLASDHPLRQKLNREQVVALLGAEATKQLPRGKAGAVYSTTGGGVELSVAAQILGYDNATEMLDAIRSTRPMDEQIEAVTDATMRETYGDPMTDGSIPEVAIETLHNASLDRMRQLEMEAILRDHPEAFRDAIIRAASRPLNVRELKAWATERIASRTLESLRPQEYLSAERKAQKEAIQAVSKAQWANAVQAKSRQRAAAALYAEAIAVREEMDKAKKLFGKVWGPDEKIAKNRNFDLVNAARAILANYGVGKRAQEAKVYLGQMAEYDPQTAEDIRPLIDETLQLVPPRDAFKKLTVAEAQFVHEAVRAVWAQSKEAEQITIEGKKVAIQDAIEPMVLAMEAKPDVMDGAGIDRRTEFADKANRGLLTARAAGRRVESWVDLMDGGDINGPFRRALFTRIREATALKGQQTRDILTQYEGMLQVIRPFLGTAEIAAKELGTGRWVWKDTAHLLGAMLHTGNPSNFERLLAGRGWTMDQWVAMRERLIADGTLRPEHFNFVQGVWDLFEAMKPEAQKVHRRMFGRYFAEITREAFTIRFPDGTEKEYAGGYTPASKDPDASGAAAQRQAESFLEEAYGMRFPTVTKGFTMSRVQNREPLLLSLDIVTKHIDGVQKFVHLAEPVREVGRIFRNKEFRAAFDRVDPTLINEMLLPWLERTSTQRVEKPFNPFIDAAAKYLRGTAGAAFMFLNVRNALEQVTSLSTAALRVDRKYLLLATANEVQDPKAITELITQHSPYMADLVTTKVMDVARSVDKIVTQPSVFQTTQNFMAEHAYVLQVTFQDRLNRTVWYGSYLESTDKGMSVQEAVRKADADVRLTQGSFEAVDVSRIETGTPIWRAVAMFAGYFNMLANLNATEMQKAVDTMGLKKSMPKLLNVYVLGFAIPILFSGALRQAFRGFADVDGDDEWGYLDDFLAFFFGEQAKAATAMVPAAGQSVNYLIGLFDSQPMNDRISVSPAVSFLEGAGRGVKAQYDILRGDDLGRRDIRDILSFYSLMTRVPLTGFAPPATYLYDVESGRARPSGPIDFSRGLISGQPGQR